MTSKERIISALRFEEFDKVPLETDSSVVGFASDVAYPYFKYGKGGRQGVVQKKGSYIDGWGCIWECGEDGVKGEVKRPQLDCMDIEKTALLYSGKIAFWGGFDRQYLLPFGTIEEVRKEVRRIGAAFFKNNRTGIIGQCFKDKGGKDENIQAVYDEWSRL
jgi:hypothetical protein